MYEPESLIKSTLIENDTIRVLQKGDMFDKMTIPNIGLVCDIEYPRLELPSVNNFKFTP